MKQKKLSKLGLFCCSCQLFDLQTDILSFWCMKAETVLCKVIIAGNNFFVILCQSSWSHIFIAKQVPRSTSFWGYIHSTHIKSRSFIRIYPYYSGGCEWGWSAMVGGQGTAFIVNLGPAKETFGVISIDTSSQWDRSSRQQITVRNTKACTHVEQSSRMEGVGWWQKRLAQALGCLQALFKIRSKLGTFGRVQACLSSGHAETKCYLDKDVLEEDTCSLARTSAAFSVGTVPVDWGKLLAAYTLFRDAVAWYDLQEQGQNSASRPNQTMPTQTITNDLQTRSLHLGSHRHICSLLG